MLCGPPIAARINRKVSIASNHISASGFAYVLCPGDTSERVDKDRLDCRVSVEGLDRELGIDPICASTAVEEVGWSSTCLVEAIHGRHGITSAVPKASDVALGQIAAAVLGRGRRIDVRELDVEQSAVFGARRVGVARARLEVRLELWLTSHCKVVELKVRLEDTDTVRGWNECEGEPEPFLLVEHLPHLLDHRTRIAAQPVRKSLQLLRVE
jgi:hypothetical protein